ncbi:hypothetical protein [Chamaesiphon sp. VAR_48_metabat_403]|nr:hypothetical protein [Chamaesiphon sp. VAR_48_metabat_403]
MSIYPAIEVKDRILQNSLPQLSIRFVTIVYINFNARSPSIASVESHVDR